MTPIPSAFEPDEQARWLAELARAIDEAQQLAWTIGFTGGGNAEARELYGRLEAVRAEIEAMLHGRDSRPPGTKGPMWGESPEPGSG